MYDYDANGGNVPCRLVTIDISTGATSTRDSTRMIDEFEPYPGVHGRPRDYRLSTPAARSMGELPVAPSTEASTEASPARAKGTVATAG